MGRGKIQCDKQRREIGGMDWGFAARVVVGPGIRPVAAAVDHRPIAVCERSKHLEPITVITESTVHEDDRVSLAFLDVRQFRAVELDRVRLRTLIHDGTLLGMLGCQRASALAGSMGVLPQATMSAALASRVQPTAAAIG
jgi:hypothetical protein